MSASLSGLAAQFTELALAVLLAPMLTGWVNQCRAWLQNKSGPGVLQPYRVLGKLFHKEVVLAHNASLAVAASSLRALCAASTATTASGPALSAAKPPFSRAFTSLRDAGRAPDRPEGRSGGAPGVPTATVPSP